MEKPLKTETIVATMNVVFIKAPNTELIFHYVELDWGNLYLQCGFGLN